MTIGRGVALCALLVAGISGLPEGASSQEQASVLAAASVSGRVVQFETGQPLEGVTVTLISLAGTADAATRISDSGGVFSFEVVPPGGYVLSAAMLGYAGLQDTLAIASGTEVQIEIPMTLSAVALEPVVVSVTRQPVGPLRGFERRRVTTHGVFMTRSEIERRSPQRFSDLIRTIPGTRLVPSGPFGQRIYFRGGCVPDLWLDGTLVNMNQDIDNYLQPDDLEAVEVYRGPELPGEFGVNLCGAIVAWTRRGEPSKDERSVKRQLIMAGAFLLAIVLTR